MRAGGAAGRRPRSARAAPSRERRSRAPKPRQAVRSAGGRRHPQTTLTARAAVLAVALAAVALAVALPFKIWLSQRDQISSLATQTRAAQLQVQRLAAANQRWNDPAYIEEQARQRLHYVMPGKKTYVVLGKPQHAPARAASGGGAASTAPWYTQLWDSVQRAGTGRSGK